MTKKLTVMKEKDGGRGLVPNKSYGMRDKVYNEYLNTINPRGNEDLQHALAECPDVRFQEFLSRVNTPRFRRVSLAAIAKACGIDMLEFNQWWQKASAQRALAIAQMGTVQITKDMLEDAKSKDGECKRCDGLGFIAAPEGLPDTVPGYKQIERGEDPKWIRTCPECEGKTKVRKPGDAVARDRILDMAGVMPKGKGGPSITLNFGGANPSAVVSHLDKVMDITDYEETP